MCGLFNKKLEEYDDDYLKKAYEELMYLHNNGEFQKDYKYFKELWDLRKKLYQSQCSLECVENDLLHEISRRWSARNKIKGDFYEN